MDDQLNPLSTAEVFTLPKEEALEKFKEYSASVKRSHSAMDRLMVQTFRALSKGLGVINVPEAIKKAGVTEDYKPKLAIMRADQPIVHFHRASAGAGRYSFSERYYLSRNSRKARAARLQFVVPEHTFPAPPRDARWPNDYWWTLSAPVPPIPPAHRRGLCLLEILHFVGSREVGSQSATGRPDVVKTARSNRTLCCRRALGFDAS